jgi:predicted TIM-barrel fold metal-dependent hydrolase
MAQAELPELPYKINDADNHFVEPHDMYERYIDARWRDKAVHVTYDDRGLRVELFGGRPSKVSGGFVRRDDLSASEERLEVQAGDELQQKPGDGQKRAPGTLLNKLNPFRGLSDAEKAALLAEFREQEEAHGNRELRLALMDDQGINAAIMFPGTVLNLEFEFQDDVDAIYANTRAFNRWIHEEIGFAHENRMFLPPYISLADVDLAVAELETVLAQGTPMVQFMSGHAHGGRDNTRGGRSIADPIFDPVWARINEAGVRVATHLGYTDYAKYGADWSEDPAAVLGNFDALQWVLYWGDRPAFETVVGMIMHNLFGRFPNIRVVLAEQGTVWLPYALRKMDHAHALGRRAKWGSLPDRPKEIFARHFLVAPFPEENVERVVADVGIDPIVFGSDFPHGEGLAFPRQYASTQLRGFTPAQVKAIMCDHLADFLGLAA